MWNHIYLQERGGADSRPTTSVKKNRQNFIAKASSVSSDSMRREAEKQSIRASIFEVEAVPAPHGKRTFKGDLEGDGEPRHGRGGTRMAAEVSILKRSLKGLRPTDGATSQRG